MAHVASRVDLRRPTWRRAIRSRSPAVGGDRLCAGAAVVNAPVPLRRSRWWGLLLVVMVAVAALAAAQLLHPPVAGSAVRGTVPGPPAVGDCLLDPTALGQGGSTPPAAAHPWLRTGPCQGRRFGEVAAVLTAGDLPTPSAPSESGSGSGSGDLTVSDRYSRPCWAAVTGWLGLPTPGGPPIKDRWEPDPLIAGVVLSGPSQIQRAAGQDWVACIAAGKDSAGAGPGIVDDSSDAMGYDTTARDTFDPGPPLPIFASCYLRAEHAGDYEVVVCATAHPVELLESMVSDRPVTDQDRRGCRAVARQLTGMPDPTAGGKLSTIVDDAQAPGGPHFLSCLMVTVGAHQLTGPLLGLKDGPVPLA